MSDALRKSNNKYSVLHLIGNFDVDKGGAQKVVRDICNLSAPDVATHHVIHFFGNGTLASEVQNATVKGLSARTIFDPIALFRLYRLLRNLNPTLVHLHSPVVASVGRFLCFFLKIKTVVTIHNTHYSFGLRMLEKVSINSSCFLVGVSSQALNFAKNELSYSGSTRVVYNGLDTARITNVELDVDVKRAEFGVGSDIFLLCSIGRHSYQKGYDVLLQSMQRLVLAYPNVKLILVGRGEETESLKQLAKDLDIDRNVIFAGGRNDVFELLKIADLCVFPSRWEGFGLAAVEAQIAGKAVIASDIPVFREVLSDGAMYSPLEPEKLANCIETLMSENSSRLELERRAGLAAQQFDVGTMVDEYSKVYQLALRL